MSISHLFKDPSLQLRATLRIVGDQEPIFGPGRLQLLQQIEQTSSISQAAKNMKMSYKKAWQMINSMNSQAKTPLIITQTGGNSGGGAIVTSEGKAVMAYYEALHKRFLTFLNDETKNLMT